MFPASERAGEAQEFFKQLVSPINFPRGSFLVHVALSSFHSRGNGCDGKILFFVSLVVISAGLSVRGPRFDTSFLLTFFLKTCRASTVSCRHTRKMELKFEKIT